MVKSYLFQDVWAFFLISARLLGALSFFPGFGEVTVNPRVRLFVGLSVAVCIAPLVQHLPQWPDHPMLGLYWVAREAIVGIFIGIFIRSMLSFLEIAGAIISQQANLTSSLVVNLLASGQGSLPGSLLSMTAIVIVFASNTHHLMLIGFLKSYEIFPIHGTFMIESFTEGILILFGHAFYLSLQISAPFLVYAFALSFGMGILNRLIPQIQIFFLSSSIQTFLGLLLMMATFGTGLVYFLEQYRAVLKDFLGIG